MFDSGGEIAAAGGQARVGKALNGEVESVLRDWIPVKNHLSK